MMRRVGLFLVVVVVFPLVVAANASAQGSVLTITPKTATVGQEVRITGTTFASIGASPVFIRLNTRTAEPVREATPDARGNIDTTFPLPPAVTPGRYLVIATQTTTVNGRQRAFTPGRTRFQVVGAAAAAGGGRSAGGPSAPLMLTVAVLGLILLGGAALTARRLRAPDRPQVGTAGSRPDA